MPGLAETAELAVRISLKDNASAGLKGLQSNVNSLSASLGRVGKGVGQVGAGIARAGVRIGAAVVTGLGLAAKTAIDFEDAFAGVRKTVEASPQELDALYGSLRNLATRIPIKFTDLAAIAQEAGALGVQTKDVAGFTEVVGRLSAATVGLSTDAAAEAFGKLGNVLFTTKEKADGLIDEYNRMGSALVALGNAGASSEGDIIEVAKRFGAAGHAAGLSAAQILGVSSALASLGVEPEAAGSSLARLFNKLTLNLALGNKQADSFAKTLGLTTAQAKKAFGSNALGTFEKFAKKLAGLDKFQQARVLKAAGVTNIRDINAIRLLSQQYAELQRQVDLSTKAYDENVALQEVSQQRFKTLKNSLITLKNLFFDSAVTLASGFTPALGRAADKIRELVSQPGTQASLKSIGEDIGSAIDNINWQSVIDGAKTLEGLFKGALGFALEMAKVIDKLPGPIKEAGLGFLTLNKLSGGLIGTGVGNIVGGIGGVLTKSLGSRLPGVGKLFAQPVFVTNWPLGGLGGGGGVVGGAKGIVGKAVGGLGTALGGGTALGVAGLLASGAVIVAAAAATQKLLVEPGLQRQAGQNISEVQGVIGSGNVADMQRALDGIRASTEHLDPIQKVLYELNADGVKTHVEGLEAALEGAIRQGSQIDNSPTARDERANAAMTQAAIRANQVALAAAQHTARDDIVGAVRGGAGRTVSAIDRNRPIVHVNVTTNVTTGSIARAIKIHKTYSGGTIGGGHTGGQQEFG